MIRLLADGSNAALLGPGPLAVRGLYGACAGVTFFGLWTDPEPHMQVSAPARRASDHDGRSLVLRYCPSTCCLQEVECVIVRGGGVVRVLGAQGSAVIQALAERVVHWFDRPEHVRRLRRSRLGRAGGGARPLRHVDVYFCFSPLGLEVQDTLLMLPMMAALAFAIEDSLCKPQTAGSGEMSVVEGLGASYGAFLPR